MTRIRKGLVKIGVTNYPNGINVGSAAGGTAPLEVGGSEIGVTAAHLRKTLAHVTAGGKLLAAGTVIVPTGDSGTTFTSGLTTVNFVVASVYNAGTPLLGFASCQAYIGGGGTVTVVGLRETALSADVQGTATWIAIGS